MKFVSLTRKLLAAFIYLIGAVCVLATAALFINLGMLSHELAKLPFMRIHPIYSGGEIVETISVETAPWSIHRPVFDGLLWQRKHGFIQIDATCGTLPIHTVEKTLDYDKDGQPDFTLVLPANADGEPEVVVLSPHVTGLENWAYTGKGWIIRVGLNRK